MTAKMKTKDRKDWQANPENIDTPKVSVYSESGTMMTAMMGWEKARELVASGRAFVIASGSIGLCDYEAE